MTNTANIDQDTLLALDALATAVKLLGESVDSDLFDAYNVADDALRDALRNVLGSPRKASLVLAKMETSGFDLLAAVEWAMED